MDLTDEIFFRTVLYPKTVRSNTVRAKAFRPAQDDHGSGLSVYCNLPSIQDLESVDRYLDWASRKITGKLGVCALAREQVEMLALALDSSENEAEEGDDAGKVYEKQHCLIINWDAESRCPTEEQVEQLARKATENGFIILPEGTE